MRLLREALTGIVGIVVAISACAHRGAAPAGSAAVSADSVAALLHDRFAVAPITLELRAGQRVSVGIGRAPWADSSEAVQFDRAYDVARLVWDRYGAAEGVDTVSVRTAFVPRDAAPGTAGRQEYFFYPSQLTAGERPRLGPTR